MSGGRWEEEVGRFWHWFFVVVVVVVLGRGTGFCLVVGDDDVEC